MIVNNVFVFNAYIVHGQKIFYIMKGCDPMEKDRVQVKAQSAICGLFCPSCVCFIDTKEDPEKLKEKAQMYGIAFEDMRCLGCRSDTLNIYCREKCYMKPCAENMGIDFCGECPEYPCAQLKDFQTERPHRLELWESQERIKEVGYEKWYMEMVEHYSCPECNTINSAYNLSCRNCNADPSCEYVRIHRSQIEAMTSDEP